MVKLGGRLLEGLLGIDAGHRGPRVGCGNGHQAQFVSYRAKTIDTVAVAPSHAAPGLLPLRRRAAAGTVPHATPNSASRRASLSPGLRQR